MASFFNLERRCLMDYQALKEEIIEYAHSIGIDEIGFTTADPFHEFRDRIISYYEHNDETVIEKRTIEASVDPTISSPMAKSIIAIALGYPSRSPKDAPKSRKGDRRGIFARASWGVDYHQLLRKRPDK